MVSLVVLFLFPLKGVPASRTPLYQNNINTILFHNLHINRISFVRIERNIGSSPIFSGPVASGSPFAKRLPFLWYLFYPGSSYSLHIIIHRILHFNLTESLQSCAVVVIHQLSISQVDVGFIFQIGNRFLHILRFASGSIPYYNGLLSGSWLCRNIGQLPVYAPFVHGLPQVIVYGSILLQSNSCFQYFLCFRIFFIIDSHHSQIVQ